MSEIETKTERGGISVEIEHIFPIIKKWLYSEKEIFLREIVSNACDAVTKLKRLISLGETHEFFENISDDFKIKVSLNKTARTITITDNGIGMTEDELRRYICQIALSGALEFIEKYEGESNDSGIIGHFGLGFYSSFMVSQNVEVITKSFRNSPAVKWECGENGEYEITTPYDGDVERGTSVIMHISEEGEEFLSEYKLKEILDKYCAFMPIEIYFEDEEKIDEADSDLNIEGSENTDDDLSQLNKSPKPINDIHPLWTKNAAECTDNEYKEFYHKVFKDYREPLFYIHINADYPLNFKGILYFPRLANEYENLEGQVKLYYNQVFVADNIKEVIPEFLLLLRGVLDCPELPLNVSRSYLQNSGYVSKISAHIIKKVADKINAIFNNEREKFEELWSDIKTFVEYGCIRDSKFYDRVKNSVLFETTGEKYVTLTEYLESAQEKHEKTVYYTNDKISQAQYISMYTNEEISVAVMDKVIDSSFIGTLERQNEGVKFVRVDADIAGALKGNGMEIIEENIALSDVFKKISNNDKLTVKFEALKDTSVPAIFNISEESRRMEDMMKLYAMKNESSFGAFPLDTTLILNSASPLIKKLCTLAEAETERSERIAKQVYTLALLSQRRLTADELRTFLTDSFGILENI